MTPRAHEGAPSEQEWRLNPDAPWMIVLWERQRSGKWLDMHWLDLESEAWATRVMLALNAYEPANAEPSRSPGVGEAPPSLAESARLALPREHPKDGFGFEVRKREPSERHAFRALAELVALHRDDEPRREVQVVLDWLDSLGGAPEVDGRPETFAEGRAKLMAELDAQMLGSARVPEGEARRWTWEEIVAGLENAELQQHATKLAIGLHRDDTRHSI